MSPILQRELRAAGRDPSLPWLRLLAAAGALLVFGLLLAMLPGGTAAPGRDLFLGLHTCLTVGLLLLAPALTADSLTRERRDGTLNFLLATPVSAGRLVFGKAQVNILRLGSLWLATIPVGVMPLTMGAVQWTDIITTLGFEFAAGSLGLSAGLLASATARDWEHALRMAYGLTAALAAGTAAVTLALSLAAALIGPADAALVGGFGAAVFGGALSASLLLLAGLRARRSARQDAEGPPPPAAGSVEDWEVQHAAATAHAWRHGHGRDLRDRQPLLWLRRRDPRATGLPGWWCGIIAAGWLLAVAGSSGRPAQAATLVLVLVMARTSARAFREEIRNGTLELLLCTPLSTGQLLTSRVRMVVREFLPAVLLQLVLTAWPTLTHAAPANWCSGFHLLLPVSLVVVPACGLWASPRAPFFALAAVATGALALGPCLFLGLLVAGLTAPAVVPGEPAGFLSGFATGPSLAALLVTQAGLGIAAWIAVARELRERRWAAAPVRT